MNWKDRIFSRTYLGATAAALCEFLKAAFPNNAKAIAAIQVISMLVSVFGLREAVANSSKPQ